MSALDELLLKKYRETVGELPTGLNDSSSIEEIAKAVLESTEQASDDTESDDSASDAATETTVSSAESASREAVVNVLPVYPSQQTPDEIKTAAIETAEVETTTDTDVEEQVVEETTEEAPTVEEPAVEETIVQEAIPASIEERADEVDTEQVATEAEEDSHDDAVEIPINFKPDWEIDRFPWPAICGEIEARVESELESAIDQITEACEQRGCNTVVMTSARAGSGRTTMTLCLAREAARKGLTVAIVDLDHAEPSMLERMGIDFEQGIESLDKYGVSTESICVTAVEDGVSLIPTAKAFEPEQCESDETREMLHTVAKHHDLVLIDASREVADLIAGARNFPAQGIIMINDPGAGEATQAFLEWIQEKDAWTLGVIENFAA